MLTNKQGNEIAYKTITEFIDSKKGHHFLTGWIDLPINMKTSIEVSGEWIRGYPSQYWFVNIGEYWLSSAKVYEVYHNKYFQIVDRKVKFLIIDM